MTAIVGYVLAALNLIVTIAVAARRSVDERLEDLRTAMHDELDMAYKEWGEQSYLPEAEWRNIGRSADRSSRLAHLHFALLADFQTVRSMGNLSGRSIWFAGGLLVVAIAAVVIAAAVSAGDTAKQASPLVVVLSVVVPFVGFAAQSVLMCILERSAGKARQLAGRYKRKEY